MMSCISFGCSVQCKDYIVMIVIIMESTRKQEFPDLIQLIQTERSIIITTIIIIVVAMLSRVSVRDREAYICRGVGTAEYPSYGKRWRRYGIYVCRGRGAVHGGRKLSASPWAELEPGGQGLSCAPPPCGHTPSQVKGRGLRLVPAQPPKPYTAVTNYNAHN